MNRSHVLALCTIAASLSGVSLAHAQTVVTQPAPQPTTVVTQPAQPTTVVTQPAPPPAQQTIVAVPAERERATTAGPNPTLLMSGLFTFGVPYGISVVVAAESNRDGDKNLFVPVVGPWLAYANEGSCNTNDLSCGRTTGTKVLLAGDGIFQAIGAVELVAAFLVPAQTTVASTKNGRQLMMAPSRVGSSGYGLAAAGSF
jgi:hypothetical protein